MIINSYRFSSSFDTDAQAFFTANSTLTDTAQKNAINQFVLDLKSNSLWTLGKYLYLGFLGDSTKVKYNLFNPASNVLTISSGWTFDTQGMKGNGTSAYAQTGFIPSVSASQNNKSLFVYSQENIEGLFNDIGSQSSISLNRDILLPRYAGYFYGGLSINFIESIGNTNSTGLHLQTRISNGDYKFFKGATLLKSPNNPSTGQPDCEDYLGSYNSSGTPTWYSSRKISIYGRMLGLTPTQVANLNTCINTMLTSLSIPTF